MPGQLFRHFCGLTAGSQLNYMILVMTLGQTNNLAEKYPDTLAEMKTLLDSVKQKK